MIQIVDNEFKLSPAVSRVTRAVAVKISDQREGWVAFGPTLEDAHQNTRYVRTGQTVAYRAAQLRYVEG